MYTIGQPIYDYLLLFLCSLISPLIAKVLPVHCDYITMVSSLSHCTPICPGNHPPDTPDSEKTLPLPSPLQQLLHWYISVHSNESEQFVVSNIFFDEFLHVQLRLSRPCNGLFSKLWVLVARSVVLQC